MHDGYFIYYFENRINGKLYVGKTKNPKKRFISHLSDARCNRQNSAVVDRAIRKYGIENFDFNLFEAVATESQANEAEKYWIQYLRSMNVKLYNATNGGDGASGRIHSQEEKNKRSKSLSGRTLPQSTKDKLSVMFSGSNNPFYGKTHNEETKYILQMNNKNRILSVDDVIAIRQLFETNNYSQRELGEIFGVKHNTISLIVRRKIWKNIP